MKPIEEIRKNKRLLIRIEGLDGGIGYVYLPISKKSLAVIFSWGGGWDHVSVSHKNKVPSWEEMCMVKDIFFDEEECVIQYHPPKSQYINNHPYCLHLWRPQNKEVLMPPKVMI